MTNTGQALHIAGWLLGVRAHAQTVYYHNELAGSPLAASDEGGNVLWRQSYRPSGERMLASASDNRLWFHGKSAVEYITGKVTMCSQRIFRVWSCFKKRGLIMKWIIVAVLLGAGIAMNYPASAQQYAYVTSAEGIAIKTVQARFDGSVMVTFVGSFSALSSCADVVTDNWTFQNPVWLIATSGSFGPKMVYAATLAAHISGKKLTQIRILISDICYLENVTLKE